SAETQRKDRFRAENTFGLFCGFKFAAFFAHQPLELVEKLPVAIAHSIDDARQNGFDRSQISIEQVSNDIARDTALDLTRGIFCRFVNEIGIFALRKGIGVTSAMNNLRAFVSVLLLAVFSFSAFGQVPITKKIRLSTAPIRRAPVKKASVKLPVRSAQASADL